MKTKKERQDVGLVGWSFPSGGKAKPHHGWNRKKHMAGGFQKLNGGTPPQMDGL